jgi:hypothetical protein
MSRVLPDISTKAADPPFSTADLPDGVVNQRIYAVTAVGDDGSGRRQGPYGLWVWMDDGPPLVPGDPLWTPDPASYRGANGEGLTPDERRYLAAHLHVVAEALIRTADEP